MAFKEGVFSVTLNVIHCNVLTVIMKGISKAAAVLSVLMKEYGIHCHDRGHINVLSWVFSSQLGLVE